VTAQPPLPTLVATDESESARTAIRIAAALAACGRITPEVIVVDSARTVGTDRREAVAATLRGDGAGDWPVRLRSGDPAERIIEDATTGQFALIMLGLREDAALERALHRETTIKVTRNSPAPVFGVAHWLHHLPRRILVALDFSQTSERAATLACRLLGDGGTLTLVLTDPPREDPPLAWARAFGSGTPEEIPALINRLPLPPGAQVDTLPLADSPATDLLDLVDLMSADVLAVPRETRIADDVIRDARCSMLIVPASRP
jgi:nucleotide-binding universal stress UspA family protein